MISRFSATESVSILLPSRPAPIADYLRQPLRLVRALQQGARLEVIQASEKTLLFRFVMKPLQFLQLTIRPVVDIEIHTGADGGLVLRSRRTDIHAMFMGIPCTTPYFRLDLDGHIAPRVAGRQPHLAGTANLVVAVEMPPILALTPSPVLQLVGQGLLKSVLYSMKERLTNGLVEDYLLWSDSYKSECIVS